MKKVKTWTDDIPDWAVCPIEYGDYSGITEEDEQLIYNYYNSIEGELENDQQEWTITFTCSTDDFNPSPAFGRPCATCKAEISIYEKEYNGDYLPHYSPSYEND